MNSRPAFPVAPVTRMRFSSLMITSSVSSRQKAVSRRQKAEGNCLLLTAYCLLESSAIRFQRYHRQRAARDTHQLLGLIVDLDLPDMRGLPAVQRRADRRQHAGSARPHVV